MDTAFGDFREGSGAARLLLFPACIRVCWFFFLRWAEVNFTLTHKCCHQRRRLHHHRYFCSHFGSSPLHSGLGPCWPSHHGSRLSLSVVSIEATVNLTHSWQRASLGELSWSVSCPCWSGATSWFLVFSSRLLPCCLKQASPQRALLGRCFCACSDVVRHIAASPRWRRLCPYWAGLWWRPCPTWAWPWLMSALCDCAADRGCDAPRHVLRHAGVEVCAGCGMCLQGQQHSCAQQHARADKQGCCAAFGSWIDLHAHCGTAGLVPCSWCPGEFDLQKMVSEAPRVAPCVAVLALCSCSPGEIGKQISVFEIPNPNIMCVSQIVEVQSL